MSAGTMAFGADIASFRVGRIYLDDLIAQLDDLDEFTVAALTKKGVPILVRLRFTDAWGATSWRRQLACPQCSLPARVLQVVRGGALCGRCCPRTTRHHQAKNTLAWNAGGAEFDRFLRALDGTGTYRLRRARSTGRRLQQLAGKHARAAEDAGSVVVRQTDAALRRMLAEGWRP